MEYRRRAPALQPIPFQENKKKKTIRSNTYIVPDQQIDTATH